MADTKITSLQPPQAGYPVVPATDVLPIVVIADPGMATSGSTRKVTVNQLLGAGGTATLASATITGDLTVDTSTLKVDSTNNRVGIGTATPANTLDVNGAAAFTGFGINANPLNATSTSQRQARFQNTGGDFYLGIEGSTGGGFFSGSTAYAACLYNAANTPLQFFTNGTLRSTIDTSGNSTWYVGGSTAMTLNSTGLGVGASPANGRLIVGADATTDGNGSWNTTLRNTVGAATTAPKTGLAFSGYWNGTSNFANFAGISGGKENTTDANTAGILTMWTSPNGGSPTTRLTIDSTGNVGIGVTPSAWSASFKSAQVGSRLVLTTTGSDTFFGNNFYNDGAYKFINADYATYYDQTTGKHVWGTSTTSGAANDVIAWNPAMTLDVSGRLLLGKTATSATTVGVELQPDGNVWATKAGSTSATTAWDTYSTGAAAYRFYVSMNGTVNATNTVISAISDARLKENVQDIDVGLGAILALKPRKFDWKAGKGKDIKGDRGFIAQEFEQVFPNLIDEWKDPAPEGEAPYKSVRQDLIPVLVKAIQELTARVQTLETR